MNAGASGSLGSLLSNMRGKEKLEDIIWNFEDLGLPYRRILNLKTNLARLPQALPDAASWTTTYCNKQKLKGGRRGGGTRSENIKVPL